MTRPDPTEVRRVAVVATGLIGASWAALFLGRGLRVATSDPRPDAEARLREGLDRARPALDRLGLDVGQGELVAASSVAEACAEAEFVQESAFEDLGVKVALLAEVDAAMAPDMVVASSSSGLLPSAIGARCAHPERIIVGHPFNPPYLIPLVEVVGCERTEPAVMDWAAAFYTAMGKVAIELKREIPGYVANRLQSAVFREVIHLINEDVASVEDIDRAISDGPGLRWAVQGPVLTFHQAHDGGMGAFIDAFADHIGAWVAAADKMPLGPAARARLVAGAETLAAGRDHAALAADHDQAVMAFLDAKEKG